MTSKKFVLIGGGGHAKVVLETSHLLGFSIFGIYDDDLNLRNSLIKGIEVLGNTNVFKADSAFIAIGDNNIRKKISDKFPEVVWPIIIHPSAIVSKDVYVGEGSVVMAGAIIQPGTRIGKHCIVNTGACIDHDCEIGDFVHVGPNCSLAGGVSLGEGTFIGIGSSIISNKTIGKWTNVGAGSVIITNQPDYCTTVGIPAKPIKFNYEQK